MFCILQLMSFPGAIIRWAFFRALGSKQELEEYVADHFILNGLVAIFALTAVLISFEILLHQFPALR
ncbi:MAG: hypothetical protein AAFZ15_02850 [Bacteroidota bacterium]